MRPFSYGNTLTRIKTNPCGIPVEHSIFSTECHSQCGLDLTNFFLSSGLYRGQKKVGTERADRACNSKIAEKLGTTFCALVAKPTPLLNPGNSGYVEKEQSSKPRKNCKCRRESLQESMRARMKSKRNREVGYHFNVDKEQSSGPRMYCKCRRESRTVHEQSHTFQMQSRSREPLRSLCSLPPTPCSMLESTSARTFLHAPDFPALSRGLGEPKRDRKVVPDFYAISGKPNR